MASLRLSQQRGGEAKPLLEDALQIVNDAYERGAEAVATGEQEKPPKSLRKVSKKPCSHNLAFERTHLFEPICKNPFVRTHL